MRALAPVGLRSATNRTWGTPSVSGTRLVRSAAREDKRESQAADGWCDPSHLIRLLLPPRAPRLSEIFISFRTAAPPRRRVRTLAALESGRFWRTLRVWSAGCALRRSALCYAHPNKVSSFRLCDLCAFARVSPVLKTAAPPRRCVRSWAVELGGSLLRNDHCRGSGRVRGPRAEKIFLPPLRTLRSLRESPSFLNRCAPLATTYRLCRLCESLLSALILLFRSSPRAHRTASFRERFRRCCR